MSTTTSLAGTSDLRITLAGIARLAQVKRPVVTVWRRRFASGGAAFPAPVGRDGRTELFDALDVARWLVETAHGNNPSALDDAPLFAVGAQPIDFAALSAMLALRAIAGEALGALELDELIDLADETDPDDELLFTEVEALGDLASAVARRADALAEAAYTPAAALERLVGDRVRSASPEVSRVGLTAEASALVSEIAIELALTNETADASAPCFVDPTGVGGDRLVDLAGRLDEFAELSIISADVDGEAARLLRRRIAVLGIARSGVRVGREGDFEVHGSVVHVAQYPTSNASVATPVEILDAVDQIVVQMDDSQRGVVVAPSSVLAEGGLDREASRRRAELLRSGRVRAIVALPAGLIVAHPRQRLAMWVLGPAHPEVAAADRWTLVTDLSAAVLEPGVRADLVGDLAASMGSPATVGAHAFVGSRRVPTSRLAARDGSLVAEVLPVGHTPSGGASGGRVSAAARAVPARFDAALGELGAQVPAGLARLRPAERDDALPVASLASLIAERHLRLVTGARVDAGELDADDGFIVVGGDELAGTTPIGSRRIDRMNLATRYPRVKLTEPGDVVFVSSPKALAWVDAGGASVVVSPARVLRINRNDPAGLMPEVLAADIGLQAGRGSDWRSWSVRRVQPDERSGLAAALRGIRVEAEAARRRAERLDSLERLVIAGVSAGTLTTAEPHERID